MNYVKAPLTTAVFMILALILTIGCNAPIVNEIIDTQAAYKMIQSNQANPNFVILDVRTQEEFRSGHIAKAIMIDIYLPDFKNKISELDRNKKYLVYCRTARRSAEAARLMKDLGFREVYDMAGGITQWKTEGLPIVMN
jgi:rhodanese-related sulfurtransferase